MTMTYPINQERLQATSDKVSEFTEKDRPWTRRAFTPLYQEARDWLSEQFHELGCNTCVDESGNLIARWDNNSEQTIMIGSHLDTVPHGGRYDGIYGVLVGLEVVRTLKENNASLKYNIEVVDFLSEEVSDFGLSCIGSRGMTRTLTKEMLDYSDNKKTLEKALSDIGGKTEVFLNKPSRTDIKAFLECHIEQGRVLEDKGLDIGVVTSIVGLTKLELTFKGRSNHAGTTPMDLRCDAMVVTSEFVLEMTKLAAKTNEESGEYLVATAGSVNLKPNAANVIAGAATLILDIRSTSKDVKDKFVEEILLLAENIAQKYSAKLLEPNYLSNTMPVYCDEKLIQKFSSACEKLNYGHQKMPSGAGHDCAFITEIAPSAMFFIPSKNGLSHAPDEYSSQEELGKGCQVMLEALLDIDNT